jgi:hypothetical protein
MSPRLCDLPNELLCSIADFIEDKNALCSLARVSKRYQNLAETVIYNTVLTRKASDAFSLKEAIQKRPERANYIHDLNLRPIWYHNCKSLGYHMRYIIARCSNLKNLAVESPTCNYGHSSGSDDPWLQDEQKLLVGLKLNQSSRLARVTLHLDGPRVRYWDPNVIGGAYHSWSKVMSLPSLTHLTVSCALIHDKIGVYADPNSTNLRVLELVECNITLQGLEKVLSAPKALRKLHLGM